MKWVECSPRDIVLTLLRARFEPPSAPGAGTAATAGTLTSKPASTRRAGLAPFQAHAVQRLRAILECRRGAVLADSVGLGKTHVARAIICDAVRNSGAVLVCGPAALRSHWRRHLRGIEAVEWLSHSALSRGATPRVSPTLIVVDEAHAFRNPATRRYQRLAALCTDARVLLLTATPVNNSVLDFYHLLRLFSSRQDFADVGVVDLLTAVETAGHDPVPLRRVVEAVVVRRTRELIEQFNSTLATTSTPALRFPRRERVRILHYDLAQSYPGLTGQLATALGSLRFPAHTVALTHAGAPAELMRLGLLKRLESSPTAFAASLRDYAQLLQQFVYAAEQRLWLNVRRDRTLYREIDGAVQLALDRVTLAPWPASAERRRALHNARRELGVVNGLLDSVSVAHAQRDPKLRRLDTLLDDELASDQVLIFTEYRETARMVWLHLVPRGGVALIHGGECRLGLARVGRSAVIRRFAPLSNGLPPPRPHERVRILIATDVLAEGLNLQDARVVVSYDVPWNPVRLAQRIGRIDRIGSPHERVIAYAFRPDRSIDALLGLVRRVRRKLRDIDVVGGDAPLLGTRAVALRTHTGADAAGIRSTIGSVSERLRLEYAAYTHRPSAELTPTGHSRSGVPVAGATCAVTERVAIVALRCATGVHCMAVRLHTQRGRAATAVEVDTEAVDALLLAVLNCASAGSRPDAAWLARAIRAARRRVRDPTAGGILRPGAAPPDHALRAAARAVHRWLGSRTGGATATEAARADALLQTLARGDAAIANQAADLSRAGLEDEEFVRRLGHLVDNRPRTETTQSRRLWPSAPGAIEVIGAIDVRPLRG